ncbi:hypothetical protein [Streptomyces sp. G-G2]|uniref:hypothetical protein n=1 Tax=Streptomyces sp. G-G2 TaxID=3046201 RepID=UPI0024B8F182|nr:hypothetical protein [Streptomyces sp. G-G2]MDJ0379827.1 hypothetical protein [Streptomyces sp. G-G2]
MAEAPVPAGNGPRRRTVLAALTPLAPLALTLAGCMSDTRPAAPAHGPQPPAKDALIMVMRHAEKPYAGDTGEDDEGNDDAGSLAARGRRRAEALPTLFPPTQGAVLPRPSVIFAGGAAGAARSRQTVAPLAGALSLPVRADLAVGREADVVRAALAAPAPALVCWEHTGIPRLVRALGADRVPGVPAGWPDRYDLVWLFIRRQGQWNFRELPQHLLTGDA